MTQASKHAFHDESNQKKRTSTKALILDFLQANQNKGFTFEEIAMCVVELKGNVNNTQKRCSDLYKEGKIEIVGIKDGKSLYQHIDTGLFPIPKPTSTEIWKRAIRSCVDDNVYNAIINERKALGKFLSR